MKRIVEKHLGGESSTQQFDEMIGRASGSNAPMPQPPTTYDTSKNPKHWKRKSQKYIVAQLRLSGFDPPHPKAPIIDKRELIAHALFRHIKAKHKTRSNEGQEPPTRTTRKQLET